MRRLYLLIIALASTLSVVCEPADDVAIPNGDADVVVAEVATPSEGWLELPVADRGVLYPNGVELKVESGGERNYTTYYDKSTYTAMWVAYPLEAKYMGDYKRPSSWSFNPLLDTECQVNLCYRSYENSTYARGHLIPNASRDGDVEMQRQTFYVSNSVPQVQNGFNAGVWSALERALQGIAERERIYIVAGVVFAKCGESRSVDYIRAKNDAKNIPIPNYFYKVVLRVTVDSDGVVSSAKTIGFWFENRSYADSFYNYTVSVDQVEQWTGFDFFANLPDDVETQAETNTDWNLFRNF